MRITGTGHASLYMETSAGSILCDPWVNPAYFASWFPFPDNSQLDWQQLGQCDYLYVSHLHRDHFDAKNLAENIRKDTTVLFPDFPTSSMEDELRELGFNNLERLPNEEVVDVGSGVRLMIQAMTAPTDGPLGDSSIWIDDNGLRVLNQNDARPAELAMFAELGHVHAHFLQFSGAIWYPMVYDLPPAAKQAFGKQKRERQLDRSLRYVEDLRASWVFPMAGPPCFLDDELWQFNDIFEDEGEAVGQQYPTDTGPMDILAISKDKRELLVVELKKGRASDAVVGQVQRYMGYALDELAEEGQSVRGVIIALEEDLRLQRALRVATNIDFYRYQVQFSLFRGRGDAPS